MKAILAISTALWALSPVLLAQTLYDIKFDTPDQGVNQVVVARQNQHYVSEIVFGAPEVVSSFGTGRPPVAAWLLELYHENDDA